MGLLAHFVVAGLATVYLLYSAGCVGDTKGGALGSPVAALELEGKAFAAKLLSVIVGAAFAFRVSPGSIVRKGTSAMFAMIFAFGLLFYVGIEAEVAGVRACWPQ